MTHLRNLGLSEYEEKIFIALRKLGVTQAKAISKASLVPPTAVYPNLKNLIAKGLVQRIEADPARFQVLDPKLALKALVAKRKIDLDASMENALREIDAVPAPLDRKDEPVHVSLGREMSVNLFEEISKRTKSQVFVMGWKFTSVRSSHTQVIKLLRGLSSAKKDVRLITNDPDYRKNPKIKIISELGIEVRYHPSQNFSVVIRDGEEAKITLKNKALENRVNIQVEDKDLSAAMKEYFLSVWDKAKKI